MKKIILNNGATYSEPKITSGPSQGILGEQTISFDSAEEMITTSVDQIALIQVADRPTYINSGGGHPDDPYERIVLSSGATYMPVRLIERSQWDEYAIEEIFPEGQLAFMTVDGIYAVKSGNVVMLLTSPRSSAQSQGAPQVEAQPIPEVAPAAVQQREQKVQGP